MNRWTTSTQPENAADLTVIEVTQGHFAVAETRAKLTAQPMEPRAVKGLVAMYRFDESDGSVVHDVSQVGSALDLHIDRPAAVQWQPGGGLAFRDTAIASSTAPARKVIDACRKSNKLTVEAWGKPTLASQSGPARLVTLSSDTSHRDFTLGHGGDPDELPDAAHRSFFIGRVRTTKTTVNGTPDLHSRNDSVAADLAHVVYTRSADGMHHLYVDGIERASEERPGDFSTWDKSYRLALGDEFTRDRPWRAAAMKKNYSFAGSWPVTLPIRTSSGTSRRKHTTRRISSTSRDFSNGCVRVIRIITSRRCMTTTRPTTLAGRTAWLRVLQTLRRLLACDAVLGA